VKPAVDPCAAVAADVRRGLSRPQKQLPAKYFYDEHGSRLFDEICEQPEYYVTRTEHALLAARADDIVEACDPHELVELGPGSTRKARLLLDAMRRARRLVRYVPLDVSETMVREAARTLPLAYEGLRVHPLIGDFERDLARVPRRIGRRLVAFLGSTIGNLDERCAVRLLGRVARLLRPGDRLLLGTDLVKPRSVLEPAYNDRNGVTAAFNRNILRVIARYLDGDVVPERFDHVAFYDAKKARIEMHLRAREAHVVRFAAIDFTVRFGRGETIRTEISRKWTRESAAELLARAGLELDRWYTDPKEYFGLSVSRRARERAG
jgi:L-histidine N-alpha-methyltransferase